MGLSQRIAIIPGVQATTTGALNGTIIDLASTTGGGGYGAEGVLFVAMGGVTNTTSILKTQTGTASDALSDTTGDIALTVPTLYFDHHRPTKRFIRGVLTAGGATGSSRVILSFPYGLRQEAPVFDASATGLRVYSPASGTATG